ncbi:MAG: Na+/H+ antiporter NhaC family protein [Roseibacillus sp.]
MEDHSARPRVRNLLLAGGHLLLTLGVLALPAHLRPLWPALVALVMVFATRSAALSLGTACLAALILLGVHHGEVLQQWFAPEGGLLNTLNSPWHRGALIFTLLLGSFAAVVERSGGLLPLLRAEGEVNDRTRKRFLTSVFGLGLVCFFDGLANALMIGRVARPVADRLRIPRAFLAYLVDTTSSAVACLAFLSTWIVTQLSYIASYSPIDQPAYLQFLASIPNNFYCLFALLLAFLAIRRQWLIGPMRTRQPVALEEEDAPLPAGNRQLRRALVPLLILLLSIPLAIFILYAPAEPPENFSLRIQGALNASTVPTAFVVGSALALLTAIAYFPRDRFAEAPRAALLGARQLVPALLILLLAWILGSLFSELGTAKVLSDTLGDRLPLAWFPAGVFLLGCVISFVSGTSWGTMGILMPLVLPTAGAMALSQGASPELLASLVPAVIGAVFGGAVFGDHCSPYSDTTIVSALASGVSTAEHTITQLPYALLTAATALVAGYLPIAFGLPSWFALLSGSGILVALVLVPMRRHT